MLTRYDSSSAMRRRQINIVFVAAGQRESKCAQPLYTFEGVSVTVASL